MTSLITTSLYISGSSVVDFEPPEGSEAPHASGKGAVESSLVSSGQRMMDNPMDAALIRLSPRFLLIIRVVVSDLVLLRVPLLL